MNYKDTIRALLEELEDLASDLEFDEELDVNTGNTAISLLSSILSDMEDLKRLF